MKKLSLLFIVTSLLVGCVDHDPPDIVVPVKINAEGYPAEKHLDIICIDGVKYYHNRYGGQIVPAFNANGTIKICGEK